MWQELGLETWLKRGLNELWRDPEVAQKKSKTSSVKSHDLVVHSVRDEVLRAKTDQNQYTIVKTVQKAAEH